MTVRQQTGPPRSVAAPVDFTDFYQAHFHRIAVQLYAYLGDHAEAQDLTQEAFCRMLERWSRISAYDDPSAWVRRVAWNLATSRLRRMRTAVRHLGRQREEHVPGPEPDRVALIRAPEGTVRSWLSRGRAALAGQLTATRAEGHRA
ncbi:sigma factor [Micromonospora sp. SL4-19]|uniref:sigma factor n=1 Tax=Micromonospora sp. SL4-19 TaxID=3399129 RepID=UPI003A4DF35B